MMTQPADCDVLIIGSGAAGLSAALELAKQAKVVVLSKATLESCNTQYAQGGISAVLSEEDSLDSHVEDTLNAGAGLCDPDIVNFTVSQGPERIAWLIEQGVPFTQVSDSEGHNSYHLTREGGHSHMSKMPLGELSSQPCRPKSIPIPISACYRFSEK